MVYPLLFNIRLIDMGVVGGTSFVLLFTWKG